MRHSRTRSCGDAEYTVLQTDASPLSIVPVNAKDAPSSFSLSPVQTAVNHQEDETIMIESGRTTLPEASDEGQDGKACWFAELVVARPVMVLAVAVLVLSSCVVLAVQGGVLMLKVETSGFFPTGTTISSRVRIEKLLIHEKDHWRVRSPPFKGGGERRLGTHDIIEKAINMAHTGFIGDPACVVVDIILTAPHNENVLDLKGLKAACRLDHRISYYNGGTPNCDSEECMTTVPALSLSSVILKQRKKSCKTLDSSDLLWAKSMLAMCSACMDSGSCAHQGIPCPTDTIDVIKKLFISKTGSLEKLESDATRMIRCLPRMQLALNGPLKAQAHTYLRSLFKDVLTPAAEYGIRVKGRKNLQVAFYSHEFQQEEEQDSLQFDVLLAGVAATIMFLLVLFHTQSLFITVLSSIQIVLAFPITWVIYTVLLGISFFPFMNYLGLFILFAIGADDLFIFVDAWRQSKVLLPDSTLPQKLAWAASRASKATFVTSLTTSAAFFSNCISPIPSIRLFGVFMGILILIDYVLFVAICPCILVLQDRYFQCRCSTASDTPPPASTEMGRIETFFNRIFGPLIVRFRHSILAVLGVWAVVASMLVFQFRLSEEPPQLLGPDSMMGLSSMHNPYFTASKQFALQTNDQEMWINFIWGIDTQASDTRARYQSKCMDMYSSCGEIAFEPNFHEQLTQPSMQMWLLNSCKQFEEENSVRKGSVICPMSAFDAWLEQLQTHTAAQYDAAQCTGLRVPVPEEHFHHCLMKFSEQDAAWFQRSHITNDLLPSVLYANDKVVAMTASVKSADFRDDQDLLSQVWDYSETKPIWNHWESILENVKSQAPPDINADVFYTNNNFLIVDFQDSVFMSVLQAVGVSLVVSFFVLLAMTWSVSVSALALVSISTVMSSVVAALQLLGWSLGAIESISISILAGVAVDFVVHIGHAYCAEEAPQRQAKVISALTTMGISIGMAALTTAAAAVVLLFCRTVFFQQFGTFLLLSMAFSLVFSLLGFAAACAVAGPDTTIHEVNCTPVNQYVGVSNEEAVHVETTASFRAVPDTPDDLEEPDAQHEFDSDDETEPALAVSGASRSRGWMRSRHQRTLSSTSVGFADGGPCLIRRTKSAEIVFGLEILDGSDAMEP